MRALLLACLVATLSACTYLKPYQIEVNQGNYVTQDQVDRLKVGMSKASVKAQLGTPLTESVFHANRWDYQFNISRRGEAVANHSLVVLFEDDKVKSWTNNNIPKSPLVGGVSASDQKLPNTDKGWFSSLTDWWKK
jgi:outer membrane protein assembly factor BamE